MIMETIKKGGRTRKIEQMKLKNIDLNKQFDKIASNRNKQKCPS